MTKLNAYDDAQANRCAGIDEVDENRDGVRFVSGDDLWEGATAGWYSFWDGDSTGPFDTQAEAQVAYDDNLINNEIDAEYTEPAKYNT